MYRATIMLLLMSPGFLFSGGGPKNCSTFMLKNGSALLVGHNLDESPGLDVPGYVWINPRNQYREGITWLELIASPEEYEKSVVPFGEKAPPKIRWTSRYGSITFNSEGLDFPDGGINEKGIAIFEMSLGTTKYKYEESHPTLFMPLWIQYQLDNCATLEEVVGNAHAINLQGWSWHYFVTDRDGRCAIIEYLDGEAVIHSDEAVTYPVLCNTQYDVELERLKAHRDSDGLWNQIKGIFIDPPRFIRAANLLDAFGPGNAGSPRDYALNILEDIQVSGWNKWSILADVGEMTVYLHTNRNRKLRHFSFRDFDFSGGQPSRYLDIHTGLSGDVSGSFLEYTYDANLALTRTRAGELFVERLRGLTDNGVTAEVYARRFADYAERMRGSGPR